MLKMKTKESIPLTGDQIVARYFRCLDNKDIDSMLELFDYDAELYEPFSNITGGLKGRSSIEPFFKVAMMANSNLIRTIKIEKTSKPNTITALVTYEKGDKVKSRFTFQFEDNEDGRKKIKSLQIEFI
jgi:ketosteroid isomerase-like protein